jgi:hypothetical protein
MDAYLPTPQEKNRHGLLSRSFDVVQDSDGSGLTKLADDLAYDAFLA